MPKRVREYVIFSVTIASGPSEYVTGRAIQFTRFTSRPIDDVSGLIPYTTADSYADVNITAQRCQRACARGGE
jgi:hypothetical protein